MRVFNKDENSELNFGEFKEYVNQFSAGTSFSNLMDNEDILYYLFQRVDCDGSGNISVNELKTSLWGEDLSSKSESLFMKDFIEEIQSLMLKANEDFETLFTNSEYNHEGNMLIRDFERILKQIGFQINDDQKILTL